MKWAKKVSITKYSLSHNAHESGRNSVIIHLFNDYVLAVYSLYL